MSLQITSGSMPAVAVGTQSAGWFTTNYWGSQAIMFEFSLDGITWADSITVLGGAVTQEWRPQFDGRRAYGKVMYTPTVPGSATFRMRVKTHPALESFFTYVDVSAFQPVTNFSALSFEVSTDGTTWSKPGNTPSHAATSDGGFAVAIQNVQRYVRLNGTIVIDGLSSGLKFLKFSSTGAFEWIARTNLGFGSGNQLRADANGIYYISDSSTSAATFTSANGSTYSVPGRTAAREFWVVRLSNAGVWNAHTKISFTNAASGTWTLDDVGIGGGILTIAIPVEAAAHTITYGTNNSTMNVSASGSVVRPGAVALETAFLGGKWAVHAMSATSGHKPAVAVAADGRSAFLYSTGSSSTSRVYHLATRDADGVDKGGCSWTAPGGGSAMAVGINDSRIIVLIGKTGSGTQTWIPSTDPSGTLLVGANNQLVSFLVNRETQIGIHKSSEPLSTALSASAIEVFATQNDFTFSNNQTITRFSTATPGTVVWTATASGGGAGVGARLGVVDVDSLGNLLVGVGAGTSATFTLTDHDGTTTTSVDATSRVFLAALSTQGKWGKRTESSGVGGTEPSAPFSANWPLVELPEDQPFTATVSGFDPELSPGVASLQVWDPLTDEWRDNPVSFAPQTDGAFPANLTVTMGADILTGASVTVTPITGFYGQLKALFRWKIVDDAFQTRFGPSAEFVATWLSDAPSAPVGYAPALFEEAPSTMTVTWTDLDETGGAAGRFEIFASEVVADGAGWRPTSWTKLGTKNTDEVEIGNVVLSTSALEATVTLTPKKNKSGAYRFALKVRELTGDKQESGYTVFDGTITNLPDIPEIDGRFNPIDGDGDSIDLEIGLDPAGPWGDLITLPDGTVLRVNDDGTVDVVVRGTANRYVYFIRAIDATGQVSQPKRVVAFHGNGATGAYPQRIVRNASGVVTGVEPMFYLFGITALRFEEGLDGVGFAEVEVASDQLKRRAQENSTTVIQLLDPMSVELVVTYKGVPVFVGPITEVEWGTGQATTYISARGLMSYFEHRVIKVDTEYEPADLADVAATIAANAQAESFGGLAIGTDTTDCGTIGTLPIAAGSTVLDALNAVGEKVDGPEVWINPANRVLYAKPTRGTDRKNIVRITSAIADVAELTSRAETLVTVARVVGGDDGAGGNFEAVYASSAQLAKYGRVERNYSAPQLVSNAECLAVAERIVEARHVTTPNLVLEVTVTPQRVFDLLDLGVGDVVAVDVDDVQFGRILGDYRIVNRAADLVDQADGTYRIRLNVEPAIYVAGKLVGSRSRFNPAIATEVVDLGVSDRRG